MKRDDVWKTVEREHYTRPAGRRNLLGLHTVACSRKVTTWTARMPDGRIVRGFTRRRDAVAAIESAASLMK